MVNKEVSLIKLETKHLEKVRQWRNSEDVKRYMYSQNEISKAQQKNWFDSISVDPNKVYWIIQFQEREVGLAYIVDINKTFQKAIWGFYLGDADARGFGVGIAAMVLGLNYAFQKLNLNKMICEALEMNIAAIRLYEKLGFRREAYFREHVIINDQAHNVISLGLLKSDWEKLKLD
jgi:UDP-4-amino-4,6-dideoxy-N-acetyl-beta-L-altrosamine N-acetyltransferase